MNPDLPASDGSHLAGSGRLGTLLGLLALALGWLMLFDRLRVDWEVNVQYGYGWFVPCLSLILAWRRWRTRPEPGPVRWPGAVGWGGVLLMLGLLPLRAIEEANPEWRLVLWAHGLWMVGLSLGGVHLLGGRPWARHFVFPLVFTLIAIPWPMNLEQGVIQGLMRFVASVVVQVMDLLAIPAIQRGNVIELRSGLVGVDEACSGVRSLQTALLISVFLGELHRFSWARRGVLLLASLVVAVGSNIGRSFWLTYLAAEHGTETMNDWHDTAGMTVLAVVLLGLWGLAGWLRRGGEEPRPHSRAPGLARALPVGRSLAMIAVVGFAEVGTQLWYRLHETALVENPAWTLRWPRECQGFREVPIPEQARATLRYDAGTHAVWLDSQGNHWQVFFLRWGAGRNSAQLAKGHQPEVCLRGAGMTMVAELGHLPVRLEPLELHFRQYLFEVQGRPLHVFYCNWEDRRLPGALDLVEDGSRASRWRSVLAGKRHLGQQVLEVAIAGPQTAAEAGRALAAGLSGAIQVAPR